MHLVSRLLAISLSLLLGLQFALADGGAAGEEGDLPVRVYHLDHVKGQAMAEAIKPLLSRNGTLELVPQSHREAIVVQDREWILKKVDRVVALIDVRPPQVLIEALLVQVRLDKDHINSGVDFAQLDGATKPERIAVNGVANGAKLSLVKDRDAFLRDLQKFGETKVLAAPRIMALNKQPAEIHLGDRLGYLKTTVNPTTTTQTVEFINIGTQLRVRPFVSSDGAIRLEVHAERTTGSLDEHGVPQTNTCQVTANVTLRDGATTATGGTIYTEVVEDDDLAPLRWLPCVDFLLGDPPDVTTRQELIVLLTAHIVKPQP